MGILIGGLFGNLSGKVGDIVYQKEGRKTVIVADVHRLDKLL